MLSIEEKEKILRTLEIDKEFRYAVMGLIGYKEVLEGIMALNERVIKLEERFAELSERVAKLEERFARLEERVIKLEERFAELSERVAKLEERFARLEERVIKLEERFAELSERVAKLEERFARLEERVIKLEERFAELSERVAKLEERVLRVEEELRDLGRIMNAIAHRFGILTDEGFREAMKYVVEEALGVARVSRWIYYDDKGVVYQRPSIVEVDIVIRDREHILLEVKSRVDKSDLLELYRIGKLYEEVHNLKPKLVIIGAFFAKGVDELAKDLGIELKPIAKAYS